MAPSKKTKADSAHYSRFFSLSLDMLCIAGFDGYFKELNPSWEKTLGFSKRDLLSKPWLDFVHADDRESTISAGNQLIGDADVIAFENRYRCKNGRYKWLLWNAKPVPEEKLIYAVARDITDRKQAEESLRRSHGELEMRVQERAAELVKANAELRIEMAHRIRAEQEKDKLRGQLIHSQKMEAVGRLTGGIAHDFNNLLTAIIGYSDILLTDMPAKDPSRRDMREIKKAAEQAASLTRRLLAFSRQQVLQTKVINLNALLTGMERMLRRLIGEDISIAARRAGRLGKVRADPGQMEQVILNLAVNARDAMPEGGRITIKTADTTLGSKYAKRHAGVKPGPYVMLELSDTGCGMDKNTLSHLFEPFFTTKEQGKGTGLGLATVYGIVKQSGGSIVVHSKPGHGTTFKVFLPRIKDSQEVAIVRRTKVRLKKGSETILLVEDDENVRKYLQRVLTEAGYGVLTAQKPKEALRIFNNRHDSIHLLLTDIVMPGMRGDALARHLLARYPGLRVVFTSGYIGTAGPQHDSLIRDANFVPKPIDPDRLARTVREALDARK